MGWMKHEPIEPGLLSDLASGLGGLRAKGLSCPPPALLQAAQADVLPPDRAREINQHLETCVLCKSLVADLATLDSESVELDRAARKRIWKQVQAGMPGRTAATSAPWWWLRPLPLAAAAVALVLLAVGVVRMRNQRPSETVTAENHPPVSVLAPSVFRLDKATVVLPASAAIIWRGQEDTAAKQGKELKQALVPYESGEYAEAAQRLDALRKKYPRMAEAPFYLGICQLFLGHDEQATTTLKSAVNLASPPLSEQATWYLALANFKTGKTDVAKSLLDPLCRAGGKDSERACAGVKELEARR